MAEKVRVGDRYVRVDGAKITITKVTDGEIEFSMLDEAGMWGSHTTLPVPETWTKAGSGPPPVGEKVWCINHPLREAEPGQIYCPDCVDQVAVSWAGLDPVEAADLTDALLLEEGKGHD